MELKQVPDEALVAELQRRQQPTAPTPEQVTEPNLSALKSMLKDYVEFIDSDEYHDDNDFKDFIYECAVETFYGKEFWPWINSKT